MNRMTLFAVLAATLLVAQPLSARLTAAQGSTAHLLTPELVQPSTDVAARYLRFPGFPATALFTPP